MTPCEQLGYKVGDAFVAPFSDGKIKKGDIVYLQRDDGSLLPFFAKSINQISSDACFFIVHKDESLVTKPYKPQTEAEKRGAKFGVSGVIKETGNKVIFQKERFGYWHVFNEENTNSQIFKSSEISLDHEPEYKEIPFEEATHEQRMNIDNLVYFSGEKVTEIYRFKNGSYGFTVEDPFIREVTEYLKVKVPV